MPDGIGDWGKRGRDEKGRGDQLVGEEGEVRSSGGMAASGHHEVCQGPAGWQLTKVNQLANSTTDIITGQGELPHRVSIILSEDVSVSDFRGIWIKDHYQALADLQYYS